MNEAELVRLAVSEMRRQGVAVTPPRVEMAVNAATAGRDEQQRKLHLPDGRDIPVTIAKGDPDVVEIVDERGRGRGIMLPRPYWETSVES